jgi:hypothetical protein
MLDRKGMIFGILPLMLFFDVQLWLVCRPLPRCTCPLYRRSIDCGQIDPVLALPPTLQFTVLALVGIETLCFFILGKLMLVGWKS